MPLLEFGAISELAAVHFDTGNHYAAWLRRILPTKNGLARFARENSCGTLQNALSALSDLKQQFYTHPLPLPTRKEPPSPCCQHGILS